MDVQRCRLCNSEISQEESICKACSGVPQALSPRKTSSVEEVPSHAFSLKQLLSRRGFLGSTTASLVGLLATPWRSLFQSNPHVAEASALHLDFESGDLSRWTAEGEAFLKQPIRGHRF